MREQTRGGECAQEPREERCGGRQCHIRKDIGNVRALSVAAQELRAERCGGRQCHIHWVSVMSVHYQLRRRNRAKRGAVEERCRVASRVPYLQQRVKRGAVRVVEAAHPASTRQLACWRYGTREEAKEMLAVCVQTKRGAVEERCRAGGGSRPPSVHTAALFPLWVADMERIERREAEMGRVGGEGQRGNDF